MSSSSVKLYLAVMIIAFGVMFLPQSEADVFSDCYETWSRCTRETKFFTGKIWLNCPDHCKKCKNRNGGACVEVPSSCPLIKKAFQCQCTGDYYNNKIPWYCYLQGGWMNGVDQYKTSNDAYMKESDYSKAVLY